MRYDNHNKTTAHDADDEDIDALVADVEALDEIDERELGENGA